MKKILSVLTIAAAFLLPLHPVDKAAFDRTVDFSLGIREISGLVRDPNFDLSDFGLVLIFDGSVAGITILDEDPTDFLAELEVIGGEWQGTETVSLFRVYVYVQGSDFFSRLGEASAPAAGPRAIFPNDHVLVAGNIADVYTDETGERFAVILAHYIRTLQ